METNGAAAPEILMAQIEVADKAGSTQPWVFGLSRAGALYAYDATHQGWRPLKTRVSEMVLVQIAVAARPGEKTPAVFGVTEADNTMRYNFVEEAWWPLERRVLAGGQLRPLARA